MAVASINSFMEDLRRVRDETMRSMLRFQFNVAQRLQFQIQDNIKSTFGASKSGRSEITQMSAGNTARTSGRGGKLFESVQIEKTSNGLSVNVGGVGVPYAAIHEYGGVITPKNSKYLTIPMAPKYRNHRAREFDLIVGRDSEWGAVLQTRFGEIAYLLRKKVTIPSRPYIRPAIEAVQKDSEVKLMLTTAFKSLSLEVIVE